MDFVDLASLHPVKELAMARASMLGLAGTFIEEHERDSYRLSLVPGDAVYTLPVSYGYWRQLPQGIAIINAISREEDSPRKRVEDKGDSEALPAVIDRGPRAEQPYSWKVWDSDTQLPEYDGPIGIDVETDVEGSDPNETRDKLVGVGVSFGKECIYFQWPKDHAVIQKAVEGRPWIGHNAKYDLVVLRRHGLLPGPLVGDGSLAAYLLGTKEAKLKPLAFDLFQYRMITYDDMVGGDHKVKISSLPVSRVAEYCCADAYFGVEVEAALSAQLDKQRQAIYKQMDISLVETLANMELRGIALDRTGADKRLLELELDILEREHTVTAKAALVGFEKYETKTCKVCRNGKNKRLSCKYCQKRGKITRPLMLNVESPLQMREYLHGHLGLPVQGLSNKGEPSLDALALLRLEQSAPEIIHQIRMLKQAKKEASFIRSWLEASALDGRVHCTFKSSRTASGRLSAVEPNLQQVALDWRVYFVA